MLSLPTTDAVLELVAAELRDVVLPDVSSHEARVAVEMAGQLLGFCARRAAHEIGWMVEECDEIARVLADSGDPDVVAALAEADRSEGLALTEVVERYRCSSVALIAAWGDAHRRDDQALIGHCRRLLDLRSRHEQVALGVLELVGRG